MKLAPGQRIRHKNSREFYEFMGYGMSNCGGEWCNAAFYRDNEDMYSQPVERFEQRFEELPE